MSGNDLLNIGSSGLLAFQRSLNTISHNIANVNTDGYSRQRVELASRVPQNYGYGFVGTGVDTVAVTRAYDAFVEGSLRTSISTSAEFEAFHSLAMRLDNVLADADAGMSASMQRFFDAVQDVADNPSGSVVRQVLFDEGEQLAAHFNQLAEWIEGVRGQVNSDIRSDVAEINLLSQSIAELNQAIVVEQGRSGGQPANDLLDQRDVLVKKMSELVSVTTLQQDDGALNVLIGTGQVMVRANTASTLTVFNEPGEFNQLGIAIKGNAGTLIPVTDQISSGHLGGVIGFRDRMLDTTSNNLGLVAIGLGSFFNEQHHQGMDLDGALGFDFFTVAQPQVLPQVGAAGNISVQFNDVSQLTNDDYQLQFNGGVWDLKRNTTGESVAMTGTGTAADPFIAEGLQFEITALPTNGDSYLIQPTRNGAMDIQRAIGSSRQIATAAPVRSATALTNTGSGVITSGEVTDINNAAFQTTSGQLTPPVLMRFTSGTSFDIYDNTNPTAPVLLEAGLAYDPATGTEVFPTPGGLDYGYRMQLSGAPVVGDEFSTEFNTGGIGDNRNALALVGLSLNQLMNGGTASITDSYNNMVADVAIGTQQAEHNSQAQQRLLEQAISARESVSGVNLDEEAANLVRFQQAYQAAAQVISTASTLFDTLLNAVRR